jgi:1-acyl-sn-glycerol-3-phosphate acyltransferase
MSKPFKFLKALVVAFLIVNFIISSLVARFLIPGKLNRRRFFVGNTHRFCKVILQVLGIEIVLENAERWTPEKNFLLVGNHLSYIEPLVTAAIHPVCFVTSMEMKNTPFIGLLAELSGSLFVERRSRDNLKNEIGELTSALSDDYSVIIYPEATSTNGSSVLPFKRSLLTAAVESKRAVLPICVNYEIIDDAPVTAKNRDIVCWYGTMDFAPHFWALIGQKNIRIRITLLPEISITPETTRDTLVDAAYEAITKVYRPIV